MALLTAKEVAEACGLYNKKTNKPDLATISVNKGRGNLIANENGLYDDKNDTNAAFIAKYQAKMATAAASRVPVVKSEQFEEPVRRPLAEDDAETDDGTVPETAADLKSANQTVLNKTKTIEEIREKRARTELLQLRKEKETGQVIPTDLVKLILVQFAKTVNTEFHQGIDKVITDLSAKYELPNVEQAAMRKELTDTVNKAIHRSVDTAKAGLANLIQQINDKKKALKQKWAPNY